MLSRRSIDMMLDLIENRVACMQVIDREDHRQLAILTQARKEILSLSAQVKREANSKTNKNQRIRRHPPFTAPRGRPCNVLWDLPRRRATRGCRRHSDILYCGRMYPNDMF